MLRTAPMEARAWYQARCEALSLDLAWIRARYDTLAWSRFATVLVVIGFGVVTLWKSLGAAGWATTGGTAVAFAILFVLHARLVKRRDRTLTTKAYHERGLARLDDQWAEFPEHGGAHATDDQPFALDLDIFGPGSLFQLLNDTRTTMGDKALARWLSTPADAATVRTRQEAVRELSQMGELREALAVAGARATETSPDPEPLLAWAGGPLHLRCSPGLRAFAWISPAVLLGLLALTPAGALPVWAFMIPFLVNAIVQAKLGSSLRPPIDAVTSRSDDLERFSGMLALLERAEFSSAALRGLRDRLRASGSDASVEIARLARIVSTLDARQNGAFRALIAPALLWDLHGVIAIERWQARAGKAARGWLDALAELEALNSLATLAYEHPDFAFPELDDQDLHFDATGLGHPLIGSAKRVVNDVSLPRPGTVLLVTGSNMSGKSTLLRSIGVAAVMALAGAPVCAKRLRMSACVVRTSMRVSDSLKDGISRFYAELLKIKMVTTAAESDLPVLFLLDEILHGTNSRERHIGARSIIRTLIERGATGAVSTHDLALASLADSHPDHVTLVHLQEDVVDGEMVFDYRLRQGVVQSGNALRWMRHVGLAVDEVV